MVNLDLAVRPPAYVLFVVLIGCGGVKSTTGSAAPMTESDFDVSYKQAMCDLVTKCCGPGFNAAAACNALVAPTAPEYRKYDPVQAVACIATLRGFASTCTETDSEYKAACWTVFAGAQTIGGPCHGWDDCIGSDLYCTTTGLSGNTYCQATAKSGESCVGGFATTNVNGLPCGKGFYCGPSALCLPQRGLGEACETSLSCVPSLRCEPTTLKCENKLPTGATCNTNSDCIDDGCSNGSCQARPTIATSSLCSGGGTNAVDAGM
jgi:hypothetical protein